MANWIGLDIGTSGVRGAEMTFCKHGPGCQEHQATLNKYGEVPLPHGAILDGEVVEQSSVVRAIKKLWDTAKFTHKNVLLGVANQRVTVREIELPWLPLNELRASLDLHAGELMPIPVSEALLDFYPTEEIENATGKQVRGIFVGASRQMIASNINAVEAAGLSPEGVDLIPFGLIRSLAPSQSGAATVAVVDVGARTTTITVLHHGQPRFIRLLSAGGADITDRLSSLLQVPPPEAEKFKHDLGMAYEAPQHLQEAAQAVIGVANNQIDQIRSTLDFYASATGRQTGPAELLVLTGRGAMLNGFGQYLSSATRLPAMLGDPFGTVNVGRVGKSQSELAASQASAAAAVGLAVGVAV